MVAARLNDVATLKALFARGANLTAVDENGTDALAKVGNLFVLPGMKAEGGGTVRGEQSTPKKVYGHGYSSQLLGNIQCFVICYINLY